MELAAPAVVARFKIHGKRLGASMVSSLLAMMVVGIAVATAAAATAESEGKGTLPSTVEVHANSCRSTMFRVLMEPRSNEDRVPDL